MDLTSVYVIGAPRIGTTWMQQMLSSHPLICAPQESGLFFSSYLSPWKFTWLAESVEAVREDRRSRGLQTILTRAEFDDLLRTVAAAVYQPALKVKPSARILLDKEPTSTFEIGTITTLFPMARMIRHPSLAGR